ncbi:MAG: SIMPL domain-containing protein [Pseudohaliea sp.]
MRMLALLAVTGALLLPLAASAGDNPSPRTLSVQGEGRLSVPPDEARIGLAVQARSADLATAREDVNARTAAVLAHLEGLGIAAGDISAPGLTLRPEYRWDKAREQQVLKGYLVQRRIDVRLAELGRLGLLIEGAADAGANEVSPPVLGHSEEDRLRREALAAAGRDARANAEALAASLGMTVGPARTLDAVEAPRPRPMASEMILRSADAATAAESYVTGDLVFERRVNARFDLLEPGA